MKKTLIILILGLILISGCGNLNANNNAQTYTKEQCEEFKTFEVWDTTSFVSGIINFNYLSSGCKDYQILKCRNIDRKFIEEKFPEEKYSSTRAHNSRILCYLSLAIEYRDSDICNYISEEKDFDVYWYCLSLTIYGQSSCSNIKDDYWHEQCIKDVE